MTVYADVLFLINFSLDYVSLYITGRLMSRPMRTWRLCGAAALGALYAVCALFFDISGIAYIAVTLFVSVLMCLCAFRCGDAVGVAGASILLFAVGCALGGVMTAIYSLGAGYSDGAAAEETGAGVTVFVAVLATAAVSVGGRIAKRRRGASSAKVKVVIGESSTTFDALCDSGNLLRDPVSGRAVLVLSARAAGKILPPGVCELAASGDITSGIEMLPAKERTRVRMLPVSNVYGQGLLLGYRPDMVTVETPRTATRRTARNVDCILAISEKEDGFGGCDAVLPAELS